MNTTGQPAAPSTRCIIIYADGACILGNPGVGGHGFTKTLDGETISKSGGVPALTTNNQMELVAVLQAIMSLTRKDLPAIVRSDSQYVVYGMTKWMPGWIANGWRNSSKKEVENREIWEALRDAVNAHTAGVTFEWVKGHSGDPGNEAADRLANAAAEKAAKITGPNATMPSRFDRARGLVVPVFQDESAAV